MEVAKRPQLGKFESIEKLFESRNYVASVVRTGQKKTFPDGSVEEEQETRRLRDELRALLERPRVERVSARSIGEWDAKLGAVKIVRKEGKFDGFGYTVNKVEYLEKFEALFLLELNRLEIYFNSVLVSVEQAYHLLLSQKRSHDYDKYLAYSTLSRAGYVVRKFANLADDLAATTPHKYDEKDCIWELLRVKLNPNHKIPETIRNHDRFEFVKASMESIVQKTKTAVGSYDLASRENDIFLTGKRKASLSSEDTIAKRRKFNFDLVPLQYSLLNCLRDDEDHHDFENIFEKLDIIKLKSLDDPIDEHSRTLTIDFDLFLPSGRFKKTAKAPSDFQVIVLGSDENMPSRSELAKVCRGRNRTIPLLVVSISLSKHLQAFLYYFT